MGRVHARKRRKDKAVKTIDELLDAAIDYARFTLVGHKDAELVPVFFIHYEDKNQPDTMVSAPWGDEDHKVMVIRAMRRMLSVTNAHSYWFVTEAWMAYENTRHPTGLMPSEREDKREVVIVNAFDRRGGKMRVYEICRNPDGVVIELVGDPEDDDIQFKGRMFNLFNGEG
jgi:hypothetical protein